MSVDEALLEQARPDWPIVMRLYRWDQPTLSLGRFQTLQDREKIPGLDQLPWVRRKTGGGAIVHDQEWTYSILIPGDDSKGVKGHSDLLYRAVHSSVINGLQQLGWNAQLSETCTCAAQGEKIPESFLCFLRRSPVDVVIGQYKILGSAQRRTTSGLLQHGSFLLRSSPVTPELLGVLDLGRDRSIVSKGAEGSIPDQKKLVRFLGGTNAFFAEEPVADYQVRSVAEDDSWVQWLIETLQRGVSELVQCSWETGRLNDLLRS